MKRIITVVLLICVYSIQYGQDVKLNRFSQKRQLHDSLMHQLNIAKQDTGRVSLLVQLARQYPFSRPDSAILYGYKALTLAREINFPLGECDAVVNISLAQSMLGNDSKALQTNLWALKIADKNGLVRQKANLQLALTIIYTHSKNYSKCLDVLRTTKRLYDSLHDPAFSTFTQMLLGETLLEIGLTDSAWYYCESAYEGLIRLHANWWLSKAVLDLGQIQNKKGNSAYALKYYWQAISLARDASSAFESYSGISELYQDVNQKDSSIYYANLSLSVAQESGIFPNIIKAGALLSRLYEKSDPPKALQYSKSVIKWKDSLYNLSERTSVDYAAKYDEQERQYEIDSANTAYRNRIRQYALITGMVAVLFVALILYRNNQQKQRTNTLLQQQKKEINIQKEKAEKTLTELKSTQQQLIHSEKMASLGELTAGIAHEIQNPLNFVNNFSDVNKELLSEMKAEMRQGNMGDVETIADDIIANEEKINHHGKRADAIVKGMLQHSRTSGGQREPTDINALADEYLRLAYHGFCARDKSFNAKVETDLDKTVGKINVVPQDMGIVLLNLINNAFYAVDEKRKYLDGSYEPRVEITTGKLDGKLELRVKDNGNGIPQKVIGKIFQPFFTTKPAGAGTGLGLSLSYDIIKAHGGEIKVETQENEGSEFKIQLPV